MISFSCPHSKRRETRKQDRREAILDVATRYFLDHGYSATTMSAIAATLGGSKATLWNYFPSKEELFTAVIDRATSTFRERLSKALDPCGDLSATLYDFCQRLLEKITSPDAIALHRLIVAESGRFPEVGRIFYESASKQTGALLSQFLQGAMQRGQLRQADAKDAAYFLMYQAIHRTQQRFLLSLITQVEPELIQAEAERALDLFMRVYGPETPPMPPTLPTPPIRQRHIEKAG